MGRKKEDRQAKADHKKARRLIKESEENGDDTASLAHQLAPLGLQVREIPGDGNCLFRAVSDQLEGHARNHMDYRLRTTAYMESCRDDFEPFVEDDVPFDRHLANLRKSGTFAGNDALVALARLLDVAVVIHQVGQPVWQINAVQENPKHRQIHLSYHNGDHYNSVRRLGDHSNSPAIVTGKIVSSQPSKTHSKPSSKSQSSDVSISTSDRTVVLNDVLENQIDEVANVTGITDRAKIGQLLADHDFDVSSVVQVFALTVIEDPEEQSKNDGNDERESKGSEDDVVNIHAASDNVGASSHSKHRMSRPEQARAQFKSTKQKRKEKREVKKAKQMERNRRKVIGEGEDEPEDVHALTTELECLNL